MLVSSLQTFPVYISDKYAALLNKLNYVLDVKLCK